MTSLKQPHISVTHLKYASEFIRRKLCPVLPENVVVDSDWLTCRIWHMLL